MDTAESEHLVAALRAQAGRISQQEEQLSALGRAMTALAESQGGLAAKMNAQLGALTNQVQQLVGATQAEPPEPPAPEPTLRRTCICLPRSVTRVNQEDVNPS